MPVQPRMTRKNVIFLAAIFVFFYVMFLVFLHTDEPDMHEHQHHNKLNKVRQRFIKHALKKEATLQTKYTTQIKHNKTRGITREISTTVENHTTLWGQKELDPRIKEMRKACRPSQYQSSDYNLNEWMSFNHENLGHILVSDTHRTLYCYVPKAACTNWKRAFLILNNVVDNERDAMKNAHKRIPNTTLTLNMFSKEDALYRIRNYYKFVFVRDPMSRVLSAYREKFAVNRRHRFRWLIRLANSIYFQFGQHTIPPKGDPLPQEGFNVSFQEFVRYLGNKHAKMDVRGGEHWRPMSDICHPCHIDYNFIGKFETFDDDAMHVLRALNRSDLASVVLRKSDHSTGSSSEILLKKYYSNLTMEEKQGLNWRYRRDIKVFGYSPKVR